MFFKGWDAMWHFVRWNCQLYRVIIQEDGLGGVNNSSKCSLIQYINGRLKFGMKVSYQAMMIWLIGKNSQGLFAQGLVLDKTRFVAHVLSPAR
jgi:hypothetical protein